MRRIAEIVATLAILIVLSPIFIVIATLVVFASPGNPFFTQTRIGKNGKPFQIYKFRKMDVAEPATGVAVTVTADQRLNAVGRLLERFKLDELPQFFNVLQGDMTFIGPRPELPKFTEYYKDKWQAIHTVKPGIFGYAQTICSHEGQLYPQECNDPESYYVYNILPEKLDAEIQYVNNKSFRGDLYIFFSVAVKFLLESLRITYIQFQASNSSIDQTKTMIQAKEL